MKYHSFFKHLKNHQVLIVYFTLIIIFIDVIFFLDPHTKLSNSNIIYIDLFIILCLFTFIFFDYHQKKRIFNLFNSNDKPFTKLTDSLNHEQSLYFQRLEEITAKKETEIGAILEEQKEHSELIANWVHDIKTPISVMELILETEFGEEKTETAFSLKEELTRITEKVERALYFSKLDSFNQDYFIEETDIYKIVRRVVKSNAISFISKKIGISIPQQTLMVHTDKKWLRFIIHQMISNSLKYTPTQGLISFSHEETPTAFILHMKDNGCGIKEEDIKRIFNKGFTGYNGRIHPSSTGLGLFIAKKLCEKLNLQITVKSKFGAFTIMSIQFPKTNNYLNVTNL